MRVPAACVALLSATGLIGCSTDNVSGPESGAAPVVAAVAASISAKAQLGEAIFFDQNLSANRNQSCATCHDPEWGWTGPVSGVNNAGAVYPGSFTDRFGNRKPPSAAYATPSPILAFVFESNKAEREEDALYIGGNFWDGRATGELLGNPAADQALGPFLNPLEQALPSSACVVARVCTATSYPVSFEAVWGAASCPTASESAAIETACAAGTAPALTPELSALVDQAYNRIGLTIAEFEGSDEVNSYSSKFDAYLAGTVRLSKLEKKGLNLFKGKGKCAACHILDEGPSGEPPLFTDFTFDNLGVPSNPENPFLIANPGFVDFGLGGFLDNAGRPFADDNMGKQKVPTLRNVDLRPGEGDVKAYAHNGYFKSLKGIVHFYNTRDVKEECPGAYTEQQALAADCWPEPEVDDNVNDDELGDLKLTDEQEDAIVEFLKTLSDGWLDGG